MTGDDCPEDDAAGDGLSRRGALRTMAATAVGIPFGGCSSCMRNFNPPANAPSGQTVVYETPGAELRTGTFGQEVRTSPNPHLQTVVKNERSLTTISEPQGQIALSPNANEVAYLDGSPASADLVIRKLGGGTTRYSQQDLGSYVTGGGSVSRKMIAEGHLLTLDWCSAGGSDKLLAPVAATAASEHDANFLFEFDRSARTTKIYTVPPHIFQYGVAWSPSCAKFVYKQEDSTNARATDTHLDVIDVSSGTSTNRSLPIGRNPAWGNEGIAFAHDTQTTRSFDIHLDDGSGTSQLTTTTDMDLHPVFFAQQSGESLAFWRNTGTKNNPSPEMYLIERLDKSGPYVPSKVETDRNVTTFDIG